MTHTEQSSLEAQASQASGKLSGRWPLRTMIVGSAMLFLAFFLPTIQGCNSRDYVPAEFAWDGSKEWLHGAMAKDPSDKIGEMSVFLGCIFPYGVGFIAMASGMLVYLQRSKVLFRTRRSLMIAAATGAFAADHFICLAVWNDSTDGIPIPLWIVFVLPAIWFGFGMLVLNARNARDDLSSLCWLALIGAFPALGWFAWLASDGFSNLLYGWYVGVGGTVLLVAGSIAGVGSMRRSKIELKI